MEVSKLPVVQTIEVFVSCSLLVYYVEHCGCYDRRQLWQFGKSRLVQNVSAKVSTTTVTSRWTVR